MYDIPTYCTAKVCLHGQPVRRRSLQDMDRQPPVLSSSAHLQATLDPRQLQTHKLQSSPQPAAAATTRDKAHPRPRGHVSPSPSRRSKPRSRFAQLPFTFVQHIRALLPVLQSPWFMPFVLVRSPPRDRALRNRLILLIRFLSVVSKSVISAHTRLKKII
ncbi:hypothetical protein CaCOL14_004923 [Colletotrichum acutatum]